MAHEDDLGKARTREDRLDARLVEGLALTLGSATPRSAIPALWHWMLFPDRRAPDQRGEARHPRRVETRGAQGCTCMAAEADLAPASAH